MKVKGLETKEEKKLPGFLLSLLKSKHCSFDLTDELVENWYSLHFLENRFLFPLFWVNRSEIQAVFSCPINFSSSSSFNCLARFGSVGQNERLKDLNLVTFNKLINKIKMILKLHFRTISITNAKKTNLRRNFEKAEQIIAYKSRINFDLG